MQRGGSEHAASEPETPTRASPADSDSSADSADEGDADQADSDQADSDQDDHDDQGGQQTQADASQDDDQPDASQDDNQPDASQDDGQDDEDAAYLMKVAKMYRMNGNLTDERAKLEEIIEKYPDTAPAADANKRIKEIDRELRGSGQGDAWGG